jgi:hypothetical protein
MSRCPVDMLTKKSLNICAIDVEAFGFDLV